MNKSLVLSTLTIATLLTACESTPPFSPKKLNEQARGIATVNTTPYGCKVLGEVEGKDQVTGYRGAPFLTVRDGALNDLRNNAVEAVGNIKKRVVIKITAGTAMCGGDMICPNQKMTHQYIHGYHVKGEVFECGDK